MRRFYFPDSLSIGVTVVLPRDLAHHVRVLRLSAGDEVTLFNGEGGEFTAVLTEIEKKRVCALVRTYSQREIELPFPITLAQALPEASKMDWIIEKAVELGVAVIQPLAAQRSVVRLSAERAEKRYKHWQGIVVAASEQSGRNRLVQLLPMASFSDWTAHSTEQPRVLFSPRASQSLSEWARSQLPQAVTLMIGPEGGFSPQEEELAVANGAVVLSLGPRVLRTETAGLAALAALAAIWGDM